MYTQSLVYIQVGSSRKESGSVPVAVFEVAFEQSLGHRCFNLSPDSALQRSDAIDGVVSDVGNVELRLQNITRRQSVASE